MNRDFLLLWQGQFMSQIGNQAFSIGMMYWLMENTGSSTLMGLVMMSSALPALILGPIGGALADRVSRKLIVVFSDALRGIAVIAVAVLMIRVPDNSSMVIVALIVVAIFNGAVSAAFQPAVSALIPDLVSRARLESANSASQFGTQTAMLVGQAAGGFLYRLLGAPILFLIDGISFVLSAASESFIRTTETASKDRPPIKLLVTDYRDDIVSGFHYVFSNPGTRALLVLAAIVNFVAMPIIVLMPFFVSGQLLGGPEWYGFLLAAMGVGSLVAFIVIGLFSVSDRIRPILLLVSLVGVAVSFVALGLTSSVLIALMAMCLLGSCTGVINILVISLFQKAAPAQMRGRVMSLLMVMSGAVSPIGLALGGILGDLFDHRVAVIFNVCGLIVLFIAVFASIHEPLREFVGTTTCEETTMKT